MKLVLALILCGVAFAQPSVLKSFDGSTGTAAGATPTYKDHPDMAGAVGSTEVVSFNGQEVLVQDKNGSAVAGWPKSQSTFWQSVVGVNPSSDCGQSFTPNDPDLVYDNIDQRWYAAHSAPCDYLAVSSGATFATSTWKYVAFGNANGDLIMKVGYDKNGVYVTYTNSSGTSSFCVRIPKADVLWSGGGSIVTTHIASNTTSGIDAYLRPTIDRNSSKLSTDPTYFADLDHGQNASGATVSLWLRSATWSGTTSTLSSRTTKTTGVTYNMATSDGATQQGSATKLRVAATFRFFTVPLVNGSLWMAAVNMISSAPGWNWWEVRASDFTILQEGAVSSGSYDTWLPAVGVDASGNTMFVAARSSSSEYMSIYGWYRSTGDTASTLFGPNLILAGTQPYTCSASPVGTGNYVTAQADPDDASKIWFLQEYGGSSTSCLWHTRWVELQLAAPPNPTMGGTIVKGAIMRNVVIR
jgi:hypothetical protein